jgi:glycosyltransferase involved in cell wall biosynthesis
MNILFLSELFYPHGSGGELATYLYAKLLSNTGFNVAIVTNRFLGESEISKNDNLTIYRVPLLRQNEGDKYSVLRRFDILLSSFMRRMVKWSNVVYIPKFWYSAIPLVKSYRKPIITHLHGYNPVCPLSIFYDVSKNSLCNHSNLICPPKCIYAYERPQGNFIKSIESTALNSIIGRYFGKLIKLSDAIICVSEAQRKIIIERMPCLQAKTYVIYNPMPEISPISVESNDFGYFGGPSCVRGYYILFNAVSRINHINHKVTIHATQFPSSARYPAAPLSRLGFYLYEKLDNNQYKKIYMRIRTTIVPSIWPECSPYVVSEALFHERLVIASRVGGIPEQTEGLEGSFLVEPGDSQQLANTIEYVRDLPKEVKADLGSKNREGFIKKFSNKKTLTNFISVLNKVEPYVEAM